MSDALPLATCADCIAYLRETKDETGPGLGRCRLRPEMGMVRDDLPACVMFKIRASRQGRVQPPEQKAAPGRRRRSRPAERAAPARQVPTLKRPTSGQTEGEIDMDRDGLKQVLRELLEEETLYGYPEMGARWQGGSLLLKPADPANQPKEVPIETLFHKIVMIRDRLRVLEAKLNAHDQLSEQDKVELQAYITKCYGTLTTFNVLFADRADQFSAK